MDRGPLHIHTVQYCTQYTQLISCISIYCAHVLIDIRVLLHPQALNSSTVWDQRFAFYSVLLGDDVQEVATEHSLLGFLWVLVG